MSFTEQPPPTIPPDVPRYVAIVTPEQLKSGQPISVEVKPLRVQVEFEQRMRQWLTRLAAAIP